MPDAKSKARVSRLAQGRPERRRLQIFAYDPLEGRHAENRVTVEIPYERLEPGPAGQRLVVVDYDPTQRRYYQPVDLEDPALVHTDGLAPNELDPRFHQQMVYAVSARVLRCFDDALGRPVNFRGGPLRLLPHGIRAGNAFYDPKLRGVVFGYFTASEETPGSTRPGQTVFTCLSHDVIAHEVTHALTDRLRPHYRYWTNPDVPAFHEGFADVVAIFQHFTLPGVLRRSIARSRGRLRDAGPLVELAREFGHATGKGEALRRAVDQPDPAPLRSTMECHDRGAILVAAVFDAFFRVYQVRIADLLRIASGGTGLLPDGDLHPDLIERIAREAEETAARVLKVCIRAFDYLPVVDGTFGDFLRAVVTADREDHPEDRAGMRGALIEAFRARGIYPGSSSSLSEEAVLLESAPPSMPDLPGEVEDFFLDRLRESMQPPGESGGLDSGDLDQEESERATRSNNVGGAARALQQWAVANRDALQLDPELPKRVSAISVSGFHVAFRRGRIPELSVTFAQRRDPAGRQGEERLGGLSFRGGVTVIAGMDRRVRYLVKKPMVGEEAERRFQATLRYVGECDAQDAVYGLVQAEERRTRHLRRCTFGALHGGGRR